MLLVPSEGLEAVSVPDEPTDADVASAVKLLLDDWLGDFPFHEQADRANALALVLTPFVRGRLPPGAPGRAGRRPRRCRQGPAGVVRDAAGAG